MSNTFTNAIPKLLKYGALALRKNCVIPRLVNSDYSDLAAQKGDTIDVIVPSAMAASAVTPGTIQASNVVPLKRAISLDTWTQAGFNLTAKELNEIDANGILVGQASEALKSVVESLEADLVAKMWKRTAGYAGSVSATPDGIDDITGCRKALNLNMAPKNDRALVVSSVVEDKLLQLAALTTVQNVGEQGAMIAGELGQRFGFQIASSQSLDDVSCDEGAQDGAYHVDEAAAAGATSMNIDAGTGDIHEGAMFYIGTYTNEVYVATATCTGGNDATLYFTPPLRRAHSDGDDITIVAAHTLGGLAFQRNFFSLATRPVRLSRPYPGVDIQSVVDPVSGLVLTLKNEYGGNFSENFQWSILYGCAVTRPECGVRLLSNA